MLITFSRNKIHLNIQNIECKSYIEYLGIYIDEHLQWEPQIQHVKNKLEELEDAMIIIPSIIPHLKVVYHFPSECNLGFV